MVEIDNIELQEDMEIVEKEIIIDDCKLRASAKKGEEVTDEQWLSVGKLNRDMVEEFLRNNPQLAENTFTQYKSGLRIFFYWNLTENGDKPFYKISKRDFLRYQSGLMDRGFSSSALKFKKSCVSSFNNYIENVVADDMEECKTFRNFCRGLPPLPKNKVFEKKPLNKEEYDKLVKYLTDKQSWQKLAYLQFSYSTACRKNEARQLLKEVVNYEPVVKEKDGNKIIYYFSNKIKCKGSKRNENKIKPLPFDDIAMQSMKHWLEIRGEDACSYMFVTKVNGEYRQASQSAFNTWTDEFSKVIGRRIHPHLIRSSRATIMVEHEGKDIKIAQKLLNHESSETTNLYVIRDESNDLDDMFM